MTSGQTAYAENRRHFYLCNTRNALPLVTTDANPSAGHIPFKQQLYRQLHWAIGNDAEALNHIPTVNSNTDYFYIDVNGSDSFEGSLKRLDLSSYAPAQTPTIIYEWAYAVDHVRANPSGDPVASLEKYSLGI